MSCDKYLELLSARLDGALTGDEEGELEAHLAICPDCRAAGAQLAALQKAFPELEEIEAPEGFARGVMDRIREDAEQPKVIPLFKRPQVRALAGLAACLVVIVGLYGVSRPHYDVTVRSFNKDALTVEGECPQVNASLADPELADVPQIASYAATERALGDGTEKSAPDICFTDAVNGDAPEALAPEDAPPAERLCDSAIMVLERMPEGAAELIPPETAVTYNPATGEEGYTWPDVQGEPEALAQIERLAEEQGMCVERSSRPAEEALYHLVILQPND